MKTLACLALVLGASFGCVDDASDDYPVAPGGGGEQTGTSGGGETGDGDGSTNMIQGRICRVTDLLAWSACAPANTGLGGMTVGLGGATATTNDDGTFSMPAQSGSLLSWSVSGPGLMTTNTPFSPSTTIPVIDAAVYESLLASHGIFAPDGTGAILGNVVRGGRPVGNISVSTTPTSQFGPFYDTMPSGFSINASGTRGVFWVPGLTFGGTNMNIRDLATGGSTQVNGVSVINGGITILDSVAMP